MSLNLSILFTVEFFSRLTYFGTRAVLLLFLVNSLNWQESTAVESYGYFTMIVLLAPFIGGIMADFTHRHALCALAGSVMMTVGLLILAYFPHYRFADNGIFLLALGAGFQKPAIFLLFYRQVRFRLRSADALFTILFLAITLGALLGPVLADLLTDGAKWSAYHLVIKVMFLCSLVAPALLIAFYKRFTASELHALAPTKSQTQASRPIVVFALVAGLLFWIIYSLISFVNATSNEGENASFAVLASLAILLVMIPLNMILSLGTNTKILAGIVLLALTAAALLLGWMTGVWIIIGMTIAEVLFSPLLLRLVMENSQPRYAGTIVGMLLIITYFSNLGYKGIAALDEDVRQEVFWILIAALFAVVAIFWSLMNAQKKEEVPAQPVIEEHRTEE